MKLNYLFPIFLVIVFLSACSSTGSASQDVSTITIRPEPSDEPLVNPGKGWVLMSYLPDDKSDNALSYASVGYTRFDWALLEPEEDNYNWKIIDDALAAWHEKGKKFAFGLMCANVHSQGQYVTPKWVFDAGAESRKGISEHGQAQVNLESWENEVFLEKLEDFISEMGERYDGDPRIAYIDIRSYGNWGEGHLYKIDGKPISEEGLKKHVKIHTDSFRKTQLVLPWGTKELESVYDWAVEQGIGMRRDGVLGNSNGSELTRCCNKVPAVIEWFGSYKKFSELYRDKGIDFDKTLYDSTVRACATYQNLGQYLDDSDLFLEDCKETIDKLTNLMGYHFVLKSITISEEIKCGKEFDIELEIENKGLAPAYCGGYLKAALFNNKDELVDQHELKNINVRLWKPGEVVKETVQVRLNCPTGNYKFAIGLFSAGNHGHPDILLGNDTEMIGSWHVITDVSGK